MMKEPGSLLKNPTRTRSSIKVGIFGIRRRKPAGAGGLDHINYSEKEKKEEERKYKDSLRFQFSCLHPSIVITFSSIYTENKIYLSIFVFSIVFNR